MGSKWSKDLAPGELRISEMTKSVESQNEIISNHIPKEDEGFLYKSIRLGALLIGEEKTVDFLFPSMIPESKVMIARETNSCQKACDWEEHLEYGVKRCIKNLSALLK